VPFEIAIGMNGAFWINSDDVRTTVAVTNIILNSELIKSQREMVAMAEHVLAASKSRGQEPA
jgi:exosome complex RNA-binding protein Rrp4